MPSGALTTKADATRPSATSDDAQSLYRRKNSKITIGGSELNASKTDVRPNETITINGNGFGSQTCIDPDDIKL